MNAGIRQFADQFLEGRDAGPASPGKLSQPLRARVQADGHPVTGDGQAVVQAIRVLRDGPEGHHDTRRPGGKSKLHLLRAIDAAGELERHGHGARHFLDGSQIGRPALRGAVQIPQVEQLGALLHERAGDSIRAIRRRTRAGGGAGPPDQPRSPALEVQAGDDLHHEAVAAAVRLGMVGPPPSPASSRRWKLTGMLPE